MSASGKVRHAGVRREMNLNAAFHDIEDRREDVGVGVVECGLNATCRIPYVNRGLWIRRKRTALYRTHLIRTNMESESCVMTLARQEIYAYHVLMLRA